jgi:hypothetical protein
MTEVGTKSPWMIITVVLKLRSLELSANRSQHGPLVTSLSVKSGQLLAIGSTAVLD